MSRKPLVDLRQLLRDAVRKETSGSTSEVNLSRRKLLKYGAAGTALASAGGVAAQFITPAPEIDENLLRDRVSPCFNNSPVGRPFSWSIVFPPLANAETGQERAVIQEISFVEERGKHQFVNRRDVPPTPIWGYRQLTPKLQGEADFPSPTIIARRSEEPAPGGPEPADPLARLLVTFTNNLPENEDPTGYILAGNSETDQEDHPFKHSSTVVHQHGANTDTVSDGYPEQVRRRGESQTHNYRNNRYMRPATLWYHDHSVHITSLHVYRGLAGFYILKDEYEEAEPINAVGDPAPPRLPGARNVDPGRGIASSESERVPLPGEKDRRAFDIPLVLSDKMLTPEPDKGHEDEYQDPKQPETPGADKEKPRGTLIYNNCSTMGAFGDVLTVNGRQQPFFKVANRQYRFRSLNGSDARQYRLRLRVAGLTTDSLSSQLEKAKRAKDELFWVIGTDMGLLFTPPVPTDYVHTTPAERWEFVIDFQKYPVGTRLIFVNDLADEEDEKLFPVMAFDVDRVEADPSDKMEVLFATGRILRPLDHPADCTPPRRKRFFRFDRENGYWSINGLQFDPKRVDAKPTLNTNELWQLVNNSGGWGHPVHLHLGRFFVKEIKGRKPRPGEQQGMKDTSWVGPNQETDVIHQFWNFPGLFVFHCHNGSHEDHDMMSQFLVAAGDAGDGGMDAGIFPADTLGGETTPTVPPGTDPAGAVCVVPNEGIGAGLDGGFVGGIGSP